MAAGTQDDVACSGIPAQHTQQTLKHDVTRVYLMGNPTFRGDRGSRAESHGFVISSMTDGAM